MSAIASSRLFNCATNRKMLSSKYFVTASRDFTFLFNGSMLIKVASCALVLRGFFATFFATFFAISYPLLLHPVLRVRARRQPDDRRDV